MAKDSVDNYLSLHSKLMEHQNSVASRPGPYPWEYWPHEDQRASCGFVGLVNLGATCYMATCVQQLFMIPKMRRTILDKCRDSSSSQQHVETLDELRKMFFFLLKSRRKAYDPTAFCSTYTMDHATLNTGEQKAWIYQIIKDEMAVLYLNLLLGHGRIFHRSPVQNGGNVSSFEGNQNG